MARESGADSPERQRGLTDAGLTGDKVAAFDPAAAPEEGDAEAAGGRTEPRAGVPGPAAHPGRAPFAATGPDMDVSRDLWLAAAALAALSLAGIVAGWISVAAM